MLFNKFYRNAMDYFITKMQHTKYMVKSILLVILGCLIGYSITSVPRTKDLNPLDEKCIITQTELRKTERTLSLALEELQTKEAKLDILNREVQKLELELSKFARVVIERVSNERTQYEFCQACISECPECSGRN